MANSNSSKVMDVTAPGKAPATATAKPIIVSNRPILRHDPMVVPTSDGSEANTEATATPPSAPRIAKRVSIMPLSEQPAVKDSSKVPAGSLSVSPVPVTVKAAVSDSVQSKPATPPSVTDMLSKLEQQKTVEDAAKSAAEAPAAEDAKSTPDKDEGAAPTAATEVSEAPKTDDVLPAVAATVKTPEAPKVDESAGTEAKDVQLPTSDSTTPTASQPSSSPDTQPVDSISAPDEAADDQLPPSQAMDDAKRQQEEADAAKLAAQEEIIASKRYYLPIEAAHERRGLARILILFVIVLLVAVVWLDVALDAGIVRLGSLHALTHFFQH